MDIREDVRENKGLDQKTTYLKRSHMCAIKTFLLHLLQPSTAFTHLYLTQPKPFSRPVLKRQLETAISENPRVVAVNAMKTV